METLQRVEEVKRRSQISYWVGLILGAGIFLVGVAVAIFQSSVTGLLIAIIGLLIGAIGKFDSALMSVTVNQWVSVNLQEQTIKEIQRLVSSWEKPNR